MLSFTQSNKRQWGIVAEGTAVVISLSIMLIAGIVGTCLMPARATAEQVTIGLVAPVTGPAALLGNEMVQAAKDAVKVINEAGGLLGKEVRLVIYDDACNSHEGIRVAERLVSEGRVHAVIGHCPGVAQVVAHFYEASNIIFISTSSGPGFFKGRPHGNVFYLGVSEERLAKAAADSIRKQVIGQFIGIVRDKSPFDQRLASEMAKELSNRGMSVVFNEQIMEPEKFEFLLKIQKPDIIVFTTSDPSIVLKLYGNVVPKERVVVLGMPSTPSELWDQFWKWKKEVGVEAYVFAPAAMGGLMPGMPPSTPFLEGIRILWEERIKSGAAPTVAQVYVFTAFDLLAQAISETGSTDPRAIALALRSAEKETLLGRLRSGEEGEVKPIPYQLYKGTYHVHGKSYNWMPSTAFLIECCSGMPKAAPPPPEPKSGDRLSTIWNVWAEDGHGPRFEPVTSLKPNTNYRISIDLAALQYIAVGAIAVPTSQTFQGKVEEWLKPGMPDPILKVMLLANPGKFQASSIVKDFKINLSHLRKVWKSGSTKDDDCFKTLRERFDEKKEEPDWKFGGIYFDVKTRNIGGRTAIAFSIWDKDRPIDEVSIPLCIAESPGEEIQKCGDLEKKVYPKGLSSVRLATESSEGPVAALHFVELDHDERLIGILRSQLWAADKYLVWQLNQTAAEFPTAISTQFLSSIEKPISDENLLVRGETLFELLFPANAQSLDDRNVRDEGLNVLRPYLQKNPFAQDYIPPTIFVRMVQIGPAPSLPLPLGLLAVRRDKSQKMTRTNGLFLGEYFLIETPLEMQTYAPPDECLSKWVMVLPPEDTGDQDINDARSQLGSTIVEWTTKNKAKSFNKMDDFMEWIGPSSIGQAEEPPGVLVTLSHHDSGNLYFYKIDSDKDNPLPFSKVNRAFDEPSVAILNGCGTGGVSAVGMIRQLNGRGFTSIVATSTEVGGLMAGAFLKIFADEISMSGTSNPKNIGLAYWRSVRKLSQVKPTGVTPAKPFGAQALKYCLLGNGSVAVCAPKGPNQ